MMRARDCGAGWERERGGPADEEGGRRRRERVGATLALSAGTCNSRTMAG